VDIRSCLSFSPVSPLSLVANRYWPIAGARTRLASRVQYLRSILSLAGLSTERVRRTRLFRLNKMPNRLKATKALCSPRRRRPRVVSVPSVDERPLRLTTEPETFPLHAGPHANCQTQTGQTASQHPKQDFRFSFLSKKKSRSPKFLLKTDGKGISGRASFLLSWASPTVAYCRCGAALRQGGECFGDQVVSFAPTSASDRVNEAFAAHFHKRVDAA